MLLRKSLVVVFVALSFIVPLSAQDDQVTHIVQAGENLFRISLRYGVAQEAIVSANNIANVSTIFAGQELIIPGLSVPDDSEVVENPLVAAAPAIHVVQRGDILINIARQYNITLEQLLQSNNIANPNRITPGQELKIWTSDTSLLDGGDEAAVTSDDLLTIINEPATSETLDDTPIDVLDESEPQHTTTYVVQFWRIAFRNCSTLRYELDNSCTNQ